MDYKKPITIRDSRNGDWYWVHKKVLESKELSSSEKLVYHALAYYANNDSQEAFPSIRKIAGIINVHHVTVVRAIKKLCDIKFISKKVERGRGSTYTLLKIADSGSVTLPPKDRGGSVMLTEVVANKTSNKNKINKTKENILLPDGNNILHAGHADIVSVFKTFEKINPTINYGHKTNRKAAEYLIKKFGLEKTLKTVEYAISVQGKKFAPTITTPYQLKDKLAQLIVYYQKESEKNKPRIIKI